MSRTTSILFSASALALSLATASGALAQEGAVEVQELIITGSQVELAPAYAGGQVARGGRVGLFLETDNFSDTHDRLQRAGLAFAEAPRHEAYGTVAVFTDPYGNRWDLIEYEKHND